MIAMFSTYGIYCQVGPQYWHVQQVNGMNEMKTQKWDHILLVKKNIRIQVYRHMLATLKNVLESKSVPIWLRYVCTRQC
ncbi:hypothetical protein BLOT_003455 [Blomia tropicalis]|nr:hypothetical protein BLOT_003455 [Blomia tropicalis]